MKRLLLVGFVILWPMCVDAAAEVYVCGRPDGTILVTGFVAERPSIIIKRMERDGIVPGAAACWWADSATLPSKFRNDPRVPGELLTQRHRWRRGPGNTVIVDPTVQRPDKMAILRQFAQEVRAARRAMILATPVGSNLHQALRDGDFPLARVLMGHIAARAGTAQEIMTAAEVALVRAIARDYEADLEEGSP